MALQILAKLQGCNITAFISVKHALMHRKGSGSIADVPANGFW